MPKNALTLLGCLLSFLLAERAGAQTRLSVIGGGLVPIGGLEERVEASYRLGLRAEYQPVNALGGRKLLSYFVQVNYSSLELTGDFEQALRSGGGDLDASLFDASGGVRAYSRVAPFFLSAGAGYSRYRPGGVDEAFDGLDLHGGLGFMIPSALFVLEVEGTLHGVIVQDADDFEFLGAGLALAMPF